MQLDHALGSEVLDAIANGIFVVDANASVVIWNRWMVEFSGVTADAVMGRTVSDIFPDIAGTRFDKALQQALSHRLAAILSPSIHAPVLPLYRHAEHRARDERMQQLINITPIRMGERFGCTVQIQDMTSAVLRERRLREQAQELARSNAALQVKLDEVNALQVQLGDMQHRDALTGLYNRAYLNDVLERELLEARRVGAPLSLVLLDLDQLKIINDTYGQLAGDEVIKSMGSLLVKDTVSAAIGFRHGGDEFMVILPGVSLNEAATIAEKWCRGFEQTRQTFGNFQLSATLSVGVTGYPAHGKTVEELAQCADLAVYLAKHDGGNRVTVFDAGS